MCPKIVKERLGSRSRPRGNDIYSRLGGKSIAARSAIQFQETDSDRGTCGSPHYLYEHGWESLIFAKAVSRIGDDCLSHTSKYTVRVATRNLIESLISKLSVLGDVKSSPTDNYRYDMWISSSSKVIAFVMLAFMKSSSRSNAEHTIEVRPTVIACKDFFDKVVDIVEAELSSQNVIGIEWWYPDGGGDFSQEVFPLETPKKLHREFYPWMDRWGGSEEFGRQYLESSASVLLLIGPPGTGKTSWICDFLWRHQLDSMLAYDQKVLTSDNFYTSFLANNCSVMVIEDADSLLLPRESGNTGVTRLLTVSDGLVRIPARKKLIFTSNLESVVDVDPALLRPGRCFGVQKFRELTAAEAERAAFAAGIQNPGRSCTLAEMWNQQLGDAAAVRHPTGF